MIKVLLHSTVKNNGLRRQFYPTQLLQYIWHSHLKHKNSIILDAFVFVRGLLTLMSLIQIDFIAQSISPCLDISHNPSVPVSTLATWAIFLLFFFGKGPPPALQL